MSGIDLTEAIREASDHLHADSCPEDMCGCRCGHYDREAEIAITAALPHLEQQIREQVAAEIEASEANWHDLDNADQDADRIAGVINGHRIAARIARTRKDT